MVQFCLTIAGHTGHITALFESTPVYLGKYVTENTPEFSFTVTREHLLFEQDALYREAVEEGFRPRVFTDPFLERAAIQRAFAEFLFDYDILLFHGSAIAVDGEGYLFTAHSGTGKSTHTRLWRQVFGERAVMVNDDKPFLQLTEDGVLLHGSPWSGKHGLDANVCVPLQGLCLLERGAENQIAPMDGEELLPMLRKQAYCPMDTAKHSRFLELTARLSRQAALWKMACNKDPSAAHIAFDSMHQ